LTHTIKVAQVGRSLATALLQTQQEDRIVAGGGLDPDVVEAACLAHDIGHPPFGHLAETALQQRLRNYATLDSFEGNAQSFRIVTKLAVRSIDKNQPALNLTRATLRALLKYPWLKVDAPVGKEDKWGAYLSERSAFKWAVDTDLGPPDKRSCEAELMDLADDITYAVHDVEDFFRGGLIPLDRIASSDAEVANFTKNAWPRLIKKGFDQSKLEAALENLRSAFLPDEPYHGTREDRAALHLFASNLITRFVGSVALSSKGRVTLGDSERHEIALLKEFTWFYVIESPALMTLRHGQALVIRRLFTAADRWATEAGKTGVQNLPIELREAIRAIHEDDEAIAEYKSASTLQRRAVADYLASLTELQAVRLHERAYLGSSSAVLEPWLRA
jgi:dGTPase